MLELTSEGDSRQRAEQENVGDDQRSFSGIAPGAQLPRIVKSKQAAQPDEFVVDYFVYDEEMTGNSSELSSSAVALVGVENFEESLLDGDFDPEAEYGDREYDTDDSQNRDWDYGSGSEDDEEDGDSLDSSDSADDNRPVDPFLALSLKTKVDSLPREAKFDEGEGGDHYEDGHYHPLVFRDARRRDDGGSSDDSDGYDHFGESYVQYREFEDRDSMEG